MAGDFRRLRIDRSGALNDMGSNKDSSDLILLLPTAGPLQLSDQVLADACSMLRQRLSCDALIAAPSVFEVGLVDPSGMESDQLERGQPHRSDRARTVLVPCGFQPLQLAEIRSAWWFGHLPPTDKIYLAEPWTPKEVGQWIGHRALSEGIRVPLGMNPLTGLAHTEEEIQTLALVAFWSNRLSPKALILEETTGETSQDSSAILSADSIDAEEVATWMIQRYLRAVRSRPIHWCDDADTQWPALRRLHNELEQHLPSEYSERLDEVSPRSMGSAKIAPDASGLVPWDKIWTSFCDLAMAGGPPHRGKLLEPVKLEDIEQSPDAYSKVVAEIRRGIELASGLTTAESPYAGWVCVECDSQQMAAWLMRAILVENISVRREDNKLYLPAGPSYRIDKEIKNVITAVAKTHHYWGAHLRSRQPPKPL